MLKGNLSMSYSRKESNISRELLVVDDDMDLLHALSLRLGAYYRVHTAPNIDMALDMLGRTNGIQVVISDYMMPRGTGIDLFKQIDGNHFIKVLMTGIGDYEVAIKSINECSIDFFLKKPFDSDHLIHVLNTKYRLNAVPFLTPTEKSIARLMLNGLTVDEISNMLRISKTTFSVHKRNMYMKFNLDKDAALISELNKYCQQL